MGRIIWERCVWIFLGLMTIFLVPMCRGTTDPRDVFAINSLYAALGFPILPGWMPFGGDPCADGWQGVQCVNANITGIVLTGANLGGELGNDLGNFSSIIQIDLSNNHIGGSIPSNLPITMRTFFLSGNQFTGSIPENLSALGQLSDLSFNDNHLTGEIPDAFQQLMGLINLDLSGNNLSGQLPPSMGNLSSLTTLNIENNLFSGPIPDKLLNVPNFRRDGNPFNTTVIPSPPALSPLPSSPVAPSPALTPGKPAFGPSAPKITRKPASKAPNSVTGAKSSTTKRVTWIAIGGLVIVIVLAIGLCFCMSRYCKRSQPVRKFAQNHETGAYNDSNEKPRNNESLPKLYSPIEKGNESLNGTEGTNSVKVVNGVAVVQGRTRSLVEWFERRERLNSDEVQAPDTTPQIRPETAKISLMLNGHPQITERELTSANDGNVTEDLMQNHDVFLSTLRSRLTKLQVVRHYWEQNNIKGAIDATRKLPDHSVQADLISILMEKTEILTLDLFSCLLPVLLGLLDSKMERHASISLEMLLKLVAVFGPVVHSTISASPVVGVDLHAEQRLECCNQCFIQLQKIQKYLPVLVRRGGLLAKCAQELNLVLQNS